MCLCVCSFWDRTKSTSGDLWLISVTFCLMATWHRLLPLSKHIMSSTAVIQAMLVVRMNHIEGAVVRMCHIEVQLLQHMDPHLH